MGSIVKIEIIGLDQIIARFDQAPKKVQSAMVETMKASLVELQGSVPSYPSQRVGSSYVRTGTLGRSLGANMAGKPEGTPDIFTVKDEGAKGLAGYFGSRVEYAPRVIGAGVGEQAEVHRKRWWTIKTIAQRAAPKIERRFEQMVLAIARWLA